MRILAVINLGCRVFFFSSITLNISRHSLLACRCSAERSAERSPMGSPCVLFVSFPLLLLNICFFLCLFFGSLINTCLHISPWIYPIWDSLGFLNLGGYFLSHGRKAFDSNLKYFFIPFLFLFFLGPL